MSLNKIYAVFGLGRYGGAVAEELIRCGAEVIAVDIDEDIVNSAANSISAHLQMCRRYRPRSYRQTRYSQR